MLRAVTGKLVLGTFLAAGESEHGDVHVFGRGGCVTGRNHGIGDEQPAMGGHHFAAVTEELDALCVGHGPIANQRLRACPLISELVNPLLLSQALLGDSGRVGADRRSAIHVSSSNA